MRSHRGSRHPQSSVRSAGCEFAVGLLQHCVPVALLEHVHGCRITVRAVQGDICQRSGALHDALAQYCTAVECLSADAARSLDSAAALAVSCSKAGDMCIWLSDLPQAASHYRRCVELRRAAAQLDPPAVGARAEATTATTAAPAPAEPDSAALAGLGLESEPGSPPKSLAAAVPGAAFPAADLNRAGGASGAADTSGAAASGGSGQACERGSASAVRDTGAALALALSLTKLVDCLKVCRTLSPLQHSSTLGSVPACEQSRCEHLRPLDTATCRSHCRTASQQLPFCLREAAMCCKQR